MFDWYTSTAAYGSGVSCDTLMQDAQNVRSIALYPWMLIPGAFVIVVVLLYNFMGDGLRDAADPYK